MRENKETLSIVIPACSEAGSIGPDHGQDQDACRRGRPLRH